MKMLIFTMFLHGLATTSGCSYFTRFISFSGAPCAELQADQPEYCESLHMVSALTQPWGVTLRCGVAAARKLAADSSMPCGAYMKGFTVFWLICWQFGTRSTRKAYKTCEFATT
jgi:hypothetical protein